ncbi:MAG: EF-hand domain-containing protein [Planctomycetes bacterium]|nr:EF-hand domain-containing protein [Planctomycetota bacterium]
MKLTALVFMLFASVAVAAPQGRGGGKPKPKKGKPVKTAPAKPGAKAGAKGVAPAKPAPIVPGPKRRKDEAPTPEFADDKPSTYFAACDYDQNDWISFKEGSEALGLDRLGFSVYDIDRDGRISTEEFEKRYNEVRERTGGFRPPRSKTAEKLVPSRNAEQLRNAYDLSGDAALDLDELTKLLTEYERTQVPPDVVLEKLDRDGTDELEGQELVLFAQLLSATYTPEQAILDPDSAPKSIDALFGQVTPRDQGYNTSPQPPMIAGPVPTFRRLDLDNDGGITLDDLESLRAAMQFTVRTAAIFAALDLDQDGLLSEAEFYGSMRKPAE